MEERRELVHDRRDPAGISEVLHEVLARRLEVDERRHGAGQTVEVVEVQRHARPPGDSQKWITALVEPPMAAKTMMAFSKASRVRKLDSG